MIRLLLTLALLISECCGAALVQSNLGGNATGSGSSMSGTPFTLTSSAVGFGSTTGAGHLLVCVSWFQLTTGTAISGPSNSIVPTTTGLTWVFGEASNIYATANPGTWGMVSIYYVGNAPSTSNTTTVTGTFGTSSTTAVTGAAVQFSLYEFSGIATSSPLEFLNSSTHATGTPSTVNPGNLSTSSTDLVMSAFQSISGSSIAVGSGYTAGISATATVGQTQYQFSVAPGTIATAFGGSENFWGAAAVAFKQASASGGVSRHKGSVF